MIANLQNQIHNLARGGRGGSDLTGPEVGTM